MKELENKIQKITGNKKFKISSKTYYHPIKNMFNNKLVYFAIIVRMFIIPVVCIAIFKIFNISGMAADVVIILEACPCAAITTMFSIEFGHDENLASGSVVFTTLLSIITLPLYALILTNIIK